MRHHLMREVLMLLGGIGFGYIIAVLVARREILVDYTSGKVQSVYCLYPFSIRDNHHDRAFEVLTRKSANNGTADWHLVDHKRFVPLIEVCEYTEGYAVLRGENQIIGLTSLPDMPLANIREGATKYLEVLHQDGRAVFEIVSPKGGRITLHG